MKKQKSKQSGRTVLKQLQRASVVAPKKRKLHVHIALHPMSILALLCMGVLLVSFTLNAVADSYLVTAIVPAPALTSPAVIDSPPSGTITGAQTIVVAGSCPTNSYVNLFDNSRFVGAAICNGGRFGIEIELAQGSNRLQAQDYNITNDAGPSSGIVTVFYVPGAPTGPSGAVTPGGIVSIGQLVVTQVDNNVPYQPAGKMAVSSRPTFAGVAPPLTRVVVKVVGQSGCTAQATAQGYWKCTVPDLSAGNHTINVSGTTPLGGQLTFSPFTITVVIPSPVIVPPLTPLYLSSTYSYKAYIVGQIVTYTVSVTGGRAPYALAVSWGDGTTNLTLRMADGTYKVSHAYGWINAAKAVKTVRVQAIDAAGQTAMLQLDTVVRNPAYTGAIANITRSSGLWGLFGALRPWLWLLWPGYLIVILLVFSFWLGEHEELVLIRKRRRQAAMKGKRRQAHAHR